MPKETNPSKPTTRRYIPEEKAAAVRMVRILRVELDTDHGTVKGAGARVGDVDDGRASSLARVTL